MQVPSMKSAVSSFDVTVSKSTFGRVFRLEGSGHVIIYYIVWSLRC